MPEKFHRLGYSVVQDVVSREACDALAAMPVAGASASGGSRCLMALDGVAALAAKLQLDSRIAPLLPVNAVPVQCTYFEKSSERNWLVPMHQDLSIPVATRVEDPRLTGWSGKEGGLFVQPPAEVLEQLLAVRLHLDDCGPNDGPLRLVPRSHLAGRIGPETINEWRRSEGELACELGKGAALVMRPLILHASSKSHGSSRRRVLHFLFGPPTLPYGLIWAAGSGEGLEGA